MGTCKGSPATPATSNCIARRNTDHCSAFDWKVKRKREKKWRRKVQQSCNVQIQNLWMLKRKSFTRYRKFGFNQFIKHSIIKANTKKRHTRTLTRKQPKRRKEIQTPNDTACESKTKQDNNRQWLSPSQCNAMPTNSNAIVHTHSTASPTTR